MSDTRPQTAQSFTNPAAYIEQLVDEDLETRRATQLEIFDLADRALMAVQGIVYKRFAQDLHRTLTELAEGYTVEKAKQHTLEQLTDIACSVSVTFHARRNASEVLFQTASDLRCEIVRGLMEGEFGFDGFERAAGMASAPAKYGRPQVKAVFENERLGGLQYPDLSVLENSYADRTRDMHEALLEVAVDESRHASTVSSFDEAFSEPTLELLTAEERVALAQQWRELQDFGRQVAACRRETHLQRADRTAMKIAGLLLKEGRHAVANAQRLDTMEPYEALGLAATIGKNLHRAVCSAPEGATAITWRSATKMADHAVQAAVRATPHGLGLGLGA